MQVVTRAGLGKQSAANALKGAAKVVEVAISSSITFSSRTSKKALVEHLLDSNIGVGRLTTASDIGEQIGVEISHIGINHACVIAAARRGTSSQRAERQCFCTEHACISSAAPPAFGTIPRSKYCTTWLLPSALVNTV